MEHTAWTAPVQFYAPVEQITALKLKAVGRRCSLSQVIREALRRNLESDAPATIANDA